MSRSPRLWMAEIHYRTGRKARIVQFNEIEELKEILVGDGCPTDIERVHLEPNFYAVAVTRDAQIAYRDYAPDAGIVFEQWRPA